MKKKKLIERKLAEKQAEILLQIIEEEVEATAKRIFVEQEEWEGGAGYGLSGGSGGEDAHGIKKLMARDTLTGLAMSPVSDLANAFKKAGARLGVNIASMIGTFIGGEIAAFLPFNDPRTVKWIGEKMRYWEQTNIKFIEEQFKKETEQMRSGWETFKSDFWGIGFVASPLNAIAAAATAEKGIDAALSVANVITAGHLGALIDHIVGDVKDPGDLSSYLSQGKQNDEKRAEAEMKSHIHSAQCLANLDDPNWLDPECLGFTQRNRFPPGHEGQQDYIDFVMGNMHSLDRMRNDRYRIEYGEAPPNDNWNWDDKQAIINILKQQGYISEAQEPQQSNKLDQLVASYMKSGKPSTHPIAASIAALKKKVGEAEANKLLKAIASGVVKDPTAKAYEAAWVTKNLPVALGGIFGSLDKELGAGTVPGITPEQLASYKSNAGSIAEKLITDVIEKNPKFKAVPPPAAIQAVKNTVAAQAAAIGATPPPPAPVQPPQTQAQ